MSRNPKPKRFAKVYMSTKKYKDMTPGSAWSWRIDYESVMGGIREAGGFSDETYQRLARGEEVPIKCFDDKADWYWIAEPRVVQDAPVRYTVGTGNVASFTVEYARRSRICRLCGLPPERGPGLPFVYDYGKEYAHERCLKRETYLHPLVASDPQQYIDKEDKPMPTVHPKPDPHAECRLSLRDGVLVDDYGRTLGVGASVEASTNCGRLWLTVTVPHSDVPPDPAATRPAPAPPEPIVLKLDREIPTAELESIVHDFERAYASRPVILLPHYIRRVNKPEEDEVRADISHRADLAAASKKGWRWGLAVGVLSGLALYAVALFAVTRLKPEWLAQRPRAEVERYVDEHARESEDARARANGDGEEGK